MGHRPVAVAPVPAQATLHINTLASGALAGCHFIVRKIVMIWCESKEAFATASIVRSKLSM